MRIVAVEIEIFGLVDHFRRHVGVQIERNRDRHARPDHAAHAREQFPFAVVNVTRDHGAMQLEQDAIERSRSCDALDDLAGNAFVSILCDVGAWRC